MSAGGRAPSAGVPLEWELLRDARTIAVAARSARSDRPWLGIARYLIEAGYTVYLVNHLLDEALGRRCYDRLQELPKPVDLVDVFRRVPELPGVVDDAIEAGAGALWLQLGIVHEQAAARAREAGLRVVMDACTKVEHARMGAADRGPSGPPRAEAAGAIHLPPERPRSREGSA